MKTQKITIQAKINAEVEKVWELYTSPKHITRWNFASTDWHCPEAQNDMQIGGKYKARMEAKDGSWGFDFEATYDEINEGSNFSYTMPDKRQVSVDFAKIADGTQTTITFDPESENPLDMQKQGWQAILNNFKNYAESE